MEGGVLPGGAQPTVSTKYGAGTNPGALGRAVSGTRARSRGGTRGGRTGLRMEGRETG